MGIGAMALQNLRYRGFRTGAMLFFVCLLSACLFASITLLKSMSGEMERAVSRMGADIIVAPEGYEEELQGAMFQGTPCTIYFDRSWAAELTKIEGVGQVSPQLYIATMQESPCCDLPSQLIALDPDSDFAVSPWLREFDLKDLGPGQVVIGSSFLANVGDTLKFYDSSFTVAAKMEPTGLSYDTSIFLSFASAEELVHTPSAQTYLRFETPKDLASMVLVNVEPGHDAQQVKRDMDFAFHGQGVAVHTQNSLVSNAAEDVRQYTAYNLVLSGLLFVVVALALVIIFAITINERRREFGVLYTIGAQKGQVLTMICWEAVLISLAGGLLGVGIAWGGMGLFGNLIKLKAGLPHLALGLAAASPTALLALGLALAAGVLAGTCGVLLVARQEPIALAKEDG